MTSQALLVHAVCLILLYIVSRAHARRAQLGAPGAPGSARVEKCVWVAYVATYNMVGVVFGGDNLCLQLAFVHPQKSL